MKSYLSRPDRRVTEARPSPRGRRCLCGRHAGEGQSVAGARTPTGLSSNAIASPRGRPPRFPMPEIDFDFELYETYNDF